VRKPLVYIFNALANGNRREDEINDQENIPQVRKVVSQGLLHILVSVVLKAKESTLVRTFLYFTPSSSVPRKVRLARSFPNEFCA
jgi:hypothetical protein